MGSSSLRVNAKDMVQHSHWATYIEDALLEVGRLPEDRGDDRLFELIPDLIFLQRNTIDENLWQLVETSSFKEWGALLVGETVKLASVNGTA